MKMKRWIVGIGFVLQSMIVLADFPTEYSPSGPRPRLWLTAERVEALTLGMNSQSEVWLNFLDYCNDTMEEVPWNGAQVGVPALALMYRLTGEQRFADRAFVLMDQTSNESQGIDDAAHGYYGYLGLGYDWLYDNPGMTAERKIAYQEKMIHWSNHAWIEENYEGVFGNGQDTDAIIEIGATHLMMGCALYGDRNEAQALLDRGWWMWERGQGLDPNSGVDQWLQAQPIRKWIRNAIGGLFYPGMLYFIGNDADGLSHYWITLKTACNYDINLLEPDLAPFWANVIRTTLDLTDPPRLRIHHTGDWQDPNLIADRVYLYGMLAQASYYAERAGDTDWAAYGRGYAQTIESYHFSEFREFFFSDPTQPASNPYTANLPPVRVCEGLDYLFFRSGWSTVETWGLFSGQGGEPADHQNPDMGNFILWREDDFLTKDCRMYPDTSGQGFGVAFNTLDIQNNEDWMGTAVMADFEGSASIDRSLIHNEEPMFAYAMMQGDDQWDEDPLQWESIQRIETYRRHFFWSGDYVVVFDRLRTTDAGWCRYKIRSLTKPSLQGATISQLSANGRHKLLHRTLEPNNCTYRLVDETVEWEGLFDEWEIDPAERKWQYEIQPPDSDRVNLLHVMQMGSAEMDEFDDLWPIQESGNQGVQIGDWIVVFAEEETLRKNVQYTVQSNSGYSVYHHLLGDLEAGTYQITRNGVLFDTLVVEEKNRSLYFTTPTTGNTESIEILWMDPASISNPELY